MEWVVTTGKTIDEAKDRALDQLGVAVDDAEFEVVDEPRTGLFGRIKGEARVRARVRPTQVRPKHDRRDRRRTKSKGDGSKGDGSKGDGSKGDGSNGNSGRDRRPKRSRGGAAGSAAPTGERRESGAARSGERPDGESGEPADQNGSANGHRGSRRPRTQKENPAMDSDNRQGDDQGDGASSVPPQEVGDAAAAFMSGLVAAFGTTAETEIVVEDTDIDVRVNGDGLGLLVGPGGRTLAAVQDLARVASQRRLGDHDTRLRVDVGGYREKRRAALENFAVAVAHQVIESSQAKALEPMSSADRKAVHDAITGVDGVSSRSEGDEPNRRVIITPA